MSEPMMLFETDNVQLLALPADGPRGARLLLRVGPAGEVQREAVLLEGLARKLHLKMREWIRLQKSLRGDTPRGVRAFEVRARQYRAPRGQQEAAT